MHLTTWADEALEETWLHYASAIEHASVQHGNHAKKDAHSVIVAHHNVQHLTLTDSTNGWRSWILTALQN